MARAAAKAVSLEERVFRFFMTISVGESWVSFNDGILGAILQALTRYSANDPQIPVNDRSLFTGKIRYRYLAVPKYSPQVDLEDARQPPYCPEKMLR